MSMSGSVMGIEPVDGVYYIGSTQDWAEFCDWYNGQGSPKVVVKLTADIKVEGNKMIGGDDGNHVFFGTFDGGGHTLTVNYDASKKNDDDMYNFLGTANHFAPFRIIGSCTIQNLVVDGTIKPGDGIRAAGVAGLVRGTEGAPSIIRNVLSKVTIQGDGNHKDGRKHWGGILGAIRDDTKSAEIENCGFIGTLIDKNVWDSGCLVGDGKGYLTVRGCFVAADVSQFCTRDNKGSRESHSDLFVFNFGSEFKRFIYENNYVYNLYSCPTFSMFANKYKIPTATADQLKNGELAFLLNGQKSGVAGWGQALGTDTLPAPTTDVNKYVFKNVYDDNTKNYDNGVTLDEAKGNTANITANNNFTGNVILVRKFVKGWNSLVLPFDLTTEQVAKVFGFDAKVANFSNGAENVIEFNTADGDNTIYANVPVLLYIGDDFNLAATNVRFDGVSIISGDATVTGGYGINCVGSYVDSYKLQSNEYFINGGQLWKSEGETTLASTRAYFTVPETSAQTKVQLVIDGHSVVTGISSVKAGGRAASNSDVYTLTGVKVSNSFTGLPKGVYIVNGKKVIKK